MIDAHLNAQAMRYIGNSHPGKEAEVKVVSRVDDCDRFNSLLEQDNGTGE